MRRGRALPAASRRSGTSIFFRPKRKKMQTSFATRTKNRCFRLKTAVFLTSITFSNEPPSSWLMTQVPNLLFFVYCIAKFVFFTSNPVSKELWNFSIVDKLCKSHISFASTMPYYSTPIRSPNRTTVSKHFWEFKSISSSITPFFKRSSAAEPPNKNMPFSSPLL